ncbi:hypothetical protein PHSC3_001150 [Chlamydiales bacterium STE3]|nr:hypothetical protein PHSC3_001150 [Chlamydiales bacterium STE3]
MSSIQPEISKLGGVQQTAFTGTETTEAKKILFFDELSPSERKDLLEVIYASQNPVLVPPTHYTITDSTMGVGPVAEQSKHDTIMVMLDTWIENIKQIDEEKRRADLKRLIEGVSSAYSSYPHRANPSLDSNFPTFSVGVVLGSIGVYQAFVSTPVAQVAMNPVVDMAATTFPLVMSDMKAGLGLIGTMVIFGYGLQYGAVANQIKEADSQKFDEKTFAKNYADKVLSVIGDTQFNNYLAAIVSQSAANGEQLSEKQQSQSIALAKLILLASALGALYQAEAGRMTGQEFAAMIREHKTEIDDVIKLADGDSKNNFVHLIRGYLSFLDPPQIERFMESMMTYFDKDPSIKTLADPAKTFSGIYSSLRRNELPV